MREALAWMEAGGRARRINWRRYVRIDPIDGEPTLVEVWPSGHVCRWRPEGADLLATDWLLIASTADAHPVASPFAP